MKLQIWLILICIFSFAVCCTKLPNQDRGRLEDVYLEQIKDHLSTFRKTCDHFPTTQQGLATLTRAGTSPCDGRTIFKPEMLNDPWGTQLEYKSNGSIAIVISAGADRIAGNEDDLIAVVQ